MPGDNHQGSNPAQIRGDIQSGRTGDKIRGFDPAAAPLETDDEAAGTAMKAESTKVARFGQSQSKLRDHSTEFADAMRAPAEPANDRLPGRPMSVVFVAGGAIIIVGLIVAALLEWL